MEPSVHTKKVVNYKQIQLDDEGALHEDYFIVKGNNNKPISQSFCYQNGILFIQKKGFPIGTSFININFYRT